jgi:hypothetical protein
MTQTPAEIEADIARQRDQLADTIDELQTRVRSTAVQQAKRAGIVAGAVVVVLVGMAVVRRLRH